MRSRWPDIPVVIVDETNTTLDARRRYYDENPPKGLLRLLPRGLLVPSAPLDGYAALLDHRALAAVSGSGAALGTVPQCGTR